MGGVENAYTCSTCTENWEYKDDLDAWGIRILVCIDLYGLLAPLSRHWYVQTAQAAMFHAMLHAMSPECVQRHGCSLASAAFS